MEKEPEIITITAMNEHGCRATAIVSEDYFRRRAVHDPILRQLYKALEDPRLKKFSEGGEGQS